ELWNRALARARPGAPAPSPQRARRNSGGSLRASWADARAAAARGDARHIFDARARARYAARGTTDRGTSMNTVLHRLIVCSVCALAATEIARAQGTPPPASKPSTAPATPPASGAQSSSQARPAEKPAGPADARTGAQDK